MIKRDIDDLVYILNEIKSDSSKPKPIVFIGAGASASAGIPLTGKIIEDILEKYKEKPLIKRIDKSKELSYYELMSALSADERRELFSSYINNDNVKLNVTHVFLAQLLIEGYVDYVFTPNFDDLLLKASMLFNKIPPVYDITHGNEFTTTNFQRQSITYLHGQHFGQWLLNSEGELDKTKEIVSSLFRMVCNQRTWIIIGYSGEDELLDEIAKFGSFDNELYWIGYKENEPAEKVKNKILNVPNKNAYLISGYDSDTFFLDLHSKLKMKTPEIINRPFSYLSSVIEKIKDIEEYKMTDKEYIPSFDFFKNRLDRNKEITNNAIEEYEKTEKFELEGKIYDAILNNKFDEASHFTELVERSYENLKPLLSNLYYRWGTFEGTKFKETKDNIQLQISIDKFKIATDLNDNNYEIYFNWGFSLYSLAKGLKDQKVYQESIKIYEKSHMKYYEEFSINNHKILNNLAVSIFDLAILKNDNKLLNESIEKLEEALKVKPDFILAHRNLADFYQKIGEEQDDDNYLTKSVSAYDKVIQLASQKRKDDEEYISDIDYVNWGFALYKLAKNNESSLEDVIEKCEQALKFNSINSSAYQLLGLTFSKIAKIKGDIEIYKLSLQKFEEALKIDNRRFEVLNSYSATLIEIFNFTKEDKYLKEAKKNAQEAYSLNNKNSYNLACCYALENNKKEALKYLEEVLKNKSVSIKHILNDDDWGNYKDDTEFIQLIAKYN
ncbi:TPR end-of-group domain-containing protein [Flavobacterium columnare]|uniref:SIR2-like domain-containing protein n=1 Tax=Flavobacterium columnare TaxID=996 RepID=A0AAI8CHJ8_9FLAO|nr:SIR2 family protein [Flavobacterium columnare]AMO20303.1 hypothetical protein UN65_08080 [Flavobacterium columnare]AUX18262.1 hypothetical protein AQ623_08225 [Flavobacterium columnare]QOG57338.1 hypothetical protein HUE29_08150 [Flavobacterium columnare]QOG60062.1 hypothetical protein HUE30_08150 [Flavobacterium columnare]QOG62782.1 hypothetical protein HUE31_08150 [Flavobacterium columnare]